MSDVEGTVVDSDDEPVGVDLEPADRLFAAEEFFLPITSTSALGSNIVVQSRPANVPSDSPLGLLYVAAYANHVHVLLRPAKRKRQEKGMDLFFYLQKLQRDPSSDTGFVRADKLGARTRKAHIEFLYWLRRVTFKCRTDARSMMPQSLFKKQPYHIRCSWELLAFIAEEIYEPMVAGNSKDKLQRHVLAHLKHKLPDEGAKLDQLGKTLLPFRCSALFCTWFLDLGPELVQVLAGIAAGQSRGELANQFRDSKAHIDAFNDFVEFTAGVVSSLGARTHGSCMEIGTCTSANTPAQCHLHFFASSANAEGGFVNAEVQLMVVDPQKLLFRGKAPQHLSSSRVHKGFRAGTTVQKAMYYLLADKIGTIFQKASSTPFEDFGVPSVCGFACFDLDLLLSRVFVWIVGFALCVCYSVLYVADVSCWWRVWVCVWLCCARAISLCRNWYVAGLACTLLLLFFWGGLCGLHATRDRHHFVMKSCVLVSVFCYRISLCP